MTDQVPPNPTREAGAEPPLPAWVMPADHTAWPTHTLTDHAVRCRFAIREGWQAEPQVVATPLEVEHRYAGLYRTDWLTISFMDRADRKSDLRQWVEALVAMTGFPLPALAPSGLDDAQLVEWQGLGSFPNLARRLQVESAYLYRGMALLRSPAEYARLYFLLARRAHHAWKVALSLSSASPPGTAETRIYRNDHLRAGATFGTLALL